MNAPVLLITPPFTQLNTPYPAVQQLKGFLNTQNIPSFQADLSLELMLKLFSEEGLRAVFQEISGQKGKQNEYARKMLPYQEDYLRTIGPLIRFLQGKDPGLAYRICSGDFLPQVFRHAESDDLEWAFGSMGILDQAKHLATLCLEDLGDLITHCLDPHFGLTRYAEQIGRYAATFDELHEALNRQPNRIDRYLFDLTDELIMRTRPVLVAISIPFPGNLYMGLKIGKRIREKHPGIRVAMGGGFVSTELRSLRDPRVFDYTDFVVCDDGEAPLLQIYRHVMGQVSVNELKRSFIRVQNQVEYREGKHIPDIPVSEKGIPDYTDLRLSEYISALDVINPMHRLWADGRWNKLSLAHGCYWAKCSFCDTSLDYIARYEPGNARQICDQIEAIQQQTGQSGFHFTDEAAPPALLRQLAEEILRRKLQLSWWTNVRFEKNFSNELCRLLKKSGCIAVSGGLEVASARILKLINKGVSLEQVSRVTASFMHNDIMVHAYLMYGFPSQTAQETIDSLEVVRQLFSLGLIQSAYWHRFALTAHSPVGLHPEQYGIHLHPGQEGSFANNDRTFDDPTGCNHEAFGEGLRISLHNYMLGAGLDLPLTTWFSFPVPKPQIKPNYIKKFLQHP